MIEQTKLKTQETLEFKINEQTETFSFSPALNIIEEGEWLLEVTSFETTNSVFDITNENKVFRFLYQVIGISEGEKKLRKDYENHWGLELEMISIYMLKNLEKQGNQIKIGYKEYKLTDLNTRKNEIIKKFKNIKNDLEYDVFRMELTYIEIEKILDMKYIDASTTGYTLPPGVYEINDINSMLKSPLQMM